MYGIVQCYVYQVFSQPNHPKLIILPPSATTARVVAAATAAAATANTGRITTPAPRTPPNIAPCVKAVDIDYTDYCIAENFRGRKHSRILQF